jgi:protein-tyrosine phosphatase
VPPAGELYHFSERKLLVNCFMGINRSVTVTMAIMMALEGSSLKKVWAAVQRGRPQASPFDDNCAILVNFERQRFGHNTLSVRELQ